LRTKRSVGRARRPVVADVVLVRLAREQRRDHRDRAITAM
jgi:hypothetical protein